MNNELFIFFTFQCCRLYYSLFYCVLNSGLILIYYLVCVEHRSFLCLNSHFKLNNYFINNFFVSADTMCCWSTNIMRALRSLNYLTNMIKSLIMTDGFMFLRGQDLYNKLIYFLSKQDFLPVANNPQTNEPRNKNLVNQLNGHERHRIGQWVLKQNKLNKFTKPTMQCRLVNTHAYSTITKCAQSSLTRKDCAG